jgi:transposase-like protein
MGNYWQIHGFLSEVGEALGGAVMSLQEAGAELLTRYRYPRSQWKGLRSTSGLERLNLEFRRHVKTQGSLPSEDAVLALLFGLVATGQIVFGKLDGWQDKATALTSVAPNAEETA